MTPSRSSLVLLTFLGALSFATVGCTTRTVEDSDHSAGAETASSKTNADGEAARALLGADALESMSVASTLDGIASWQVESKQGGFVLTAHPAGESTPLAFAFAIDETAGKLRAIATNRALPSEFNIQAFVATAESDWAAASSVVPEMNGDVPLGTGKSTPQVYDGRQCGYVKETGLVLSWLAGAGISLTGGLMCLGPAALGCLPVVVVGLTIAGLSSSAMEDCGMIR